MWFEIKRKRVQYDGVVMVVTEEDTVALLVPENHQIQETRFKIKVRIEREKDRRKFHRWFYGCRTHQRTAVKRWPWYAIFSKTTKIIK